MVECIHGLDLALCDSCSPKPDAVDVKPAPRKRALAPASLRSPAPNTPPAPKPVILRNRMDDVREQRIYHVTHVKNLPGILADGFIFADASDEWTSRPVVDVSSADTRDARRSIEVAGRPLSAFVPFYLSPDARVWEGMRAGTADPRLSPEVRALPASEYVILVSAVRSVPEETAVVVSDGDAANSFSTFGDDKDGSERMLRSLRITDELERIRSAELLVEGSFPVGDITVIGVAHHGARDQVREIVDASDYLPKVSVYPPWFAKPEA